MIKKTAKILIKMKLATIAFSGFFSLATFIMIFINNRKVIETFIPFWLIIILIPIAIGINWKYIVPKEGNISARQNEFNIMIENKLERIEKLTEKLIKE